MNKLKDNKEDCKNIEMVMNSVRILTLSNISTSRRRNFLNIILFLKFRKKKIFQFKFRLLSKISCNLFFFSVSEMYY